MNNRADSPVTIIGLGLMGRALAGAFLIKSLADRSIAAGHGGDNYPVLIEEFSKE
jgi:hypothetical protein